MAELLLPSLGEGIEVGTIVSILTDIGDTIDKEQSVVEVETDKVTMEVPSPFAGKVSEILIKVGDEVSVGQAMFIILNEDQESADAPKQAMQTPIDTNENPSVVKDEIANQPQEKQEIPQNPAIRRERKEGLRATPKARKLARELGVGLGSVAAASKVLMEEDIKAHIKDNQGNVISAQSTLPLPSFEKWGDTRKEKMPAIMKATARNMMQSWREIPHAWLQGEADVTETETQRKELNKHYDLKISLTVFIAKAVAKTLKDFPKFNSSLNYQTEEIIFKDYVNIGIAADTEHGLFVPVIQGVDQLSLSQISTTITDLAARAKDKKLKMEELEGGNITISNLGGFGTTAIFPVILPPQVAIIGVASYQLRDGRKYLPLTIGFDHRVIDGADAGRFLQRLTSYLKNPVNILT